MVDVVADKPEASDRKLNLEIQKFADRFPAPATIILVSSAHSDLLRRCRGLTANQVMETSLNSSTSCDTLEATQLYCCISPM